MKVYVVERRDASRQLTERIGVYSSLAAAKAAADAELWPCFDGEGQWGTCVREPSPSGDRWYRDTTPYSIYQLDYHDD
jgi:hypothetical protein